MDIKKPYLLFLGDAPDQLAAKTARGIAFWRPEDCVGQFRLPECQADVGLSDIDIDGAAEQGARTLVVGVANRGGTFSEAWLDILEDALAKGMDLAAGLHARLADNERLRAAAEHHGRQIHDVRHPRQTFAVANGQPRPGKRMLTVGTDVSVGKMFTTLALERALKTAGQKATFRATGQTGILIAGEGVSVDAVIADFIAGATEWLTPANEEDHWDLVEGQGSLFHPSYAGVTLGLIHGARPDAMIVCHDPTRQEARGITGRRLPDLGEVIALNEMMARMVNPVAKVIAIAVNTQAMESAEAEAYCAQLKDQYAMPALDPVKHDLSPVLDRLAVF